MGDFDFQKEMLLYCRNDVDVLRRVCMKFRDMLLEITGHRSEELYPETLETKVSIEGGVDPLRYLTIAAVCINVFCSKILEEEHLVLLRTECENTKKEGSWGFTSRSTARVILGQVLRIATCGTRTHRGDSL